MSVQGVNPPSEPTVQPNSPNVLPTAPVETAKPEAKVDPLAPKFAALSRKEKEVRTQAQQIAQAKAEYESKMAEFTKQRTEWESKQKESENGYKQRLKENPINELLEAGYTTQQIAEILMNEGSPTPEMQLKRVKSELETGYKSELAELRKMLEQKEADTIKQQEEQLKAQQAQAVTAYQAEISDFITKNSDKFELSALDVETSTQTIYQTIDLYYQETQKAGEAKILSLQEAAELVENHLAEQAEKIYEVKRKREVQNAKKPDANSLAQTSPTLSNTAASEVPISGSRKLSRDEEVREAAKTFVRFID